MSEDRLIEISSIIVEKNDPLWTAGFLFSLREEGDAFFQMVLESEYKDKNIILASYLFAKSYLDKVGIEVKEYSCDWTSSKKHSSR